MLFHLNFIKLHSSLFQADRFGLSGKLREKLKNEKRRKEAAYGELFE